MKKIILIALLAGWQAGQGQDLKTVNLRCGFGKDPAGIVDPSPALSWELQSARRGVMQTAYRILVSSDSTSLAGGHADCWDSKRVRSDASILVRYAGKPLLPATMYYWKMMAWDNKGDSTGWSAIAHWQTGLPGMSDWRNAQWIGYEPIPDKVKLLPGAPPDTSRKMGPQADTLPIFRKTFDVAKPLKRATAFICGLGQFEMHLNGAVVGDHFLDPGWTNYEKSAQYVTFDITHSLRQGSNAIGVMLGNGFYYVPELRYYKLTVAYGYPKLIAGIFLEYADGTKQDVVTDPSWMTRPGPITFSSTYGGEDYDARRLPDGWDLPDAQETGWRPARIVDGPPALQPQLQEPLKMVARFDPKSAIKRGPDTITYDLGQNASGIVAIKVRGRAGQRLRIYPGELLDSTGSVTQEQSGSPFYFEYILKGAGVETWQPRFSYYGFRYLRVEGAASLDQFSIQGCHTRNSVEKVGSFSCSNEVFRRTDTLIDWAIVSNTVSLFTDCPHREKLGWLEQAHLMGSAIRYNYDIVRLYQKITRDMMEAQTKEGLMPEIAPEFTQFTEPFRDSPEWGSSCILVPWYLYQFYGDKKTLAGSYPMMKAYLGYLSRETKGHLLWEGLGDWYDLGPGDPGTSQLTPQGLTASAIYYYDLQIAEKIARMLGRREDANHYADSAIVLKKAFNEKFYNTTTHEYGTGSQAANAMAIYMGLVDPSQKAAVVENIVRDIRARGNALTAGDIGYRYLLKVLEDAGRSDVIYDMNSRSDVPGYGYQLTHGATALTETWAARADNSNNHFMLGHIMEWFYTGLAGIRQGDSLPGFRDIVLKPAVVGDIHWAKGEYHSPYGMIASSWQKKDNTFDWDITIPVNTTAAVYVPAAPGAVVTEGWKSLLHSKEFAVKARQDGYLMLRLGSGNYHFRVQQGNAVPATSSNLGKSKLDFAAIAKD